MVCTVCYWAALIHSASLLLWGLRTSCGIVLYIVLFVPLLKYYNYHRYAICESYVLLSWLLFKSLRVCAVFQFTCFVSSLCYRLCWINPLDRLFAALTLYLTQRSSMSCGAKRPNLILATLIRRAGLICVSASHESRVASASPSHYSPTRFAVCWQEVGLRPWAGRVVLVRSSSSPASFMFGHKSWLAGQLFLFYLKIPIF